jgi:hypothetical protein
MSVLRLFQRPRVATVAAILLAITLMRDVSVAQSPTDISVTGGADTQRIVVIPRPSRDAVVLSLQGSVSWENSEGSSSGFLKYRWGLLDGSGRFIPSASETPARVALESAESGFTELAVERSILAPADAASGADMLIAIRIDECGFDRPNPGAQARCMFSGTVRAQGR